MKSGGSRLAGWLACAALICVAAAGFVFASHLQTEPSKPGVSASAPEAIVGSGDGERRARHRHARPARATPRGPTLEIPAIGVKTRVVSLGKNPDGSLETPTDYSQAGWWSGGPRPGSYGPAVITGHVDSARSGPAVFYRLSEVEPGDVVRYRTRGGKLVRFMVERSERYPKDHFPTLRVYGRTDGAKLRLITCTGDFDTTSGHYRDNLVVFAHRV